MDRLHSIPDDSDVAEFDQIIVTGAEIKRLLPGAPPFARRAQPSELQRAGQWLCDGSINGWFEYLICEYEPRFRISKVCF
jgi:hypothetical protein